MKPLAYAFVVIICLIIIAAVIVNLYPYAKPLIQNLQGAGTNSIINLKP